MGKFKPRELKREDWFLIRVKNICLTLLKKIEMIQMKKMTTTNKMLLTQLLRIKFYKKIKIHKILNNPDIVVLYLILFISDLYK